MSDRHTLKITLPSGPVLTVCLWDDDTVQFGLPTEAPGYTWAPDDYRAEVDYWPNGKRRWRLRYWRGAEVMGRLSPTRFGTPGDVIASRIGGGKAVVLAINDALYARWPHLRPEEPSS